MLPVAVALALVALVAFLLPRWRRRGAGPAVEEPADVPPPGSEADRKRLDDELARYGA